MWFVRHFGVAWGTIGVLGLLLFAVYRLAPRALEAFAGGLTIGQWVIAAVICVFMAYTEGYRGFQLRFSPSGPAERLGPGSVLRSQRTRIFLWRSYRSRDGAYQSTPRG